MLSPDELARCLAVRDLTDPAAGPHAAQLLLTEILDALPVPPRVVRASPVTTVADNYELLGYPPDAVTRDARHTRYVDAARLLRSHTTAMVPPALRALAASTPPTTPPEVLLACPGLCYRRDSVDRLHTGTPHQLDLWRLRRGDPLAGDDLLDLIDTVVAAALPGATWRAVDAVHPYTEHGRQVDVRWRGEWVEVGECGLAAPAVLAAAGLVVPRPPAVGPAAGAAGDGEGWTGLAMGLGLDRLLMLRKGVPDIRLLRATDPRVAGQLLDLTPYRPVSQRPPVRRDLSLVVGADTDTTAEALGDRVRLALGADADAAETVSVLADTPHDALPDAVRARLRTHPGQRNVLVRLVLRPLDRTLTDAEANALRDRVYLALHEGRVAELATGG